MKTPCNAICCLDLNNVCIGCGRTSREIVDWAKMTDDQRNQIMERLGHEPHRTPSDQTKETPLPGGEARFPA